MAAEQLTSQTIPETGGMMPVTSVESDAPAQDRTQAQDATKWMGRIDKCKQKRKKLLIEWSKNVDYRRGKQFETDSDQDRIAVSTDWSQTKAKQAQLFSQVPQVVLTTENEAYKPAVPVFQKQLNDRLKKAKVGVAMDEVLPDCINAAGIGAVIVSYESRTVEKDMPEFDLATMATTNPEEAMLYTAGIKQMPTRKVPQVVDSRFLCERISPADLLWDSDFTGSDFDESSWIGRSGRTTWGHAKGLFKLTEDQREAVVGGDDRSHLEKLSPDLEKNRSDDDIVNFDEVFYWDYRFNPESPSFKAIHHLVFVHGVEKPVIDEPWAGQQVNEENGTYLGACRFPIRVLTLTYISDEPIPPSDSAIGRPQVDELIKSRSQMMLNREHSRPVRWYDVNRIDQTIQNSLMQGTWQAFIPTNGDGTRAVGEIARANYPRENFDFDRTIKGDLGEAWQVGPNQVGTSAPGEKSAAEASIVQANFQTRVGYERARCVAFFVGIAEVMGGLMALYDTFEQSGLSEQDKQRVQQTWDRTKVNQEFVYTVRADSTVLLDSQQRLARLEKFINLTGKSGFVNVQPIIEEMAALSGLDPMTAVQAPNPKGPEPPNVSYRFSGAADLMNPVALAILMKAGQAPTPEELDAANKLLAQVMASPTAALIMQPKGASLVADPAVAPNPAAPPPVAPAQPPAPEPSAPPMGDVHPEWQLASSIDKRQEGA